MIVIKTNKKKSPREATARPCVLKGPAIIINTASTRYPFTPGWGEANMYRSSIFNNQLLLVVVVLEVVVVEVEVVIVHTFCLIVALQILECFHSNS